MVATLLSQTIDATSTLDLQFTYCIDQWQSPGDGMLLSELAGYKPIIQSVTLNATS